MNPIQSLLQTLHRIVPGLFMAQAQPNTPQAVSTPNVAQQHLQQAQGIYSPSIPNQVEYYPGTHNQIPVPDNIKAAWAKMNTPQPQQVNAPAVNAMQYGVSQKARSLHPSQGVIDAITKASSAFNVPQNLLFDIAAQESSFDPNNRNTTPAGIAVGVPTGLFQFTPETWNGLVNPNGAGSYGESLRPYLQGQSNLDRTNPYINALAAAYLLKMGQASRWNDSQFSWGPTLSQQEAMPYYSQTMQWMPNTNWRQ